MRQAAPSIFCATRDRRAWRRERARRRRNSRLTLVSARTATLAAVLAVTGSAGLELLRGLPL